ncbi:hypothetical protein [Nitratireductor sp. XY-223]|uniref:hypothetical protein n=1 Tax=Nitratireductor sp. XY-223 TaxID=2561926 RepID=UPI0010A9994C|nr:hypothetical protein [Nitratireductor sp. XY-223]
MKDKDVKPLDGEVSYKRERHELVPYRHHLEPARAPAFVEILKAHADRRRWEAETRRKRAVADNIRAMSEVAVETQNWLKAETALEPGNLEALKETIQLQVEVGLAMQQAALQKANRGLKLAALQDEVEEKELLARIRRAEVDIISQERKLDGKDKTLDDLIGMAEDELDTLVDEFTDRKEIAEADGTELSEEEELEFSRQYQRGKDRLEELYSRRDNRQADGDV